MLPAARCGSEQTSFLGEGTRKQVAKVAAFHTDMTSLDYHPREGYVYHNQSACGYGQRTSVCSVSVIGSTSRRRG